MLWRLMVVDKRPVTMNWQNLPKKGRRRQICKKDDPDDQQRQVAKFATKKEMANIAMANDRMSELPDGVYTRPTSTTVPPLSISSL